MKHSFDCLYCNKSFIDKKHSNRKFCSKNCNVSYNRGRPKPKTILKNCIICGKEFKVNKEHAVAMKCSEKCRIIARKLNGTEKICLVEYRKTHKKSIRERNQRYYKRHREKIIDRQKQRNKVNPNYKRYRKARRYGTGQRLTIKTIQRVYEDNIKKYGTLTCELCDKVIEFGQDSLDHKLPLAKGGSNLYENLQIAHNFCNAAKQNKTMEEWEIYKSQIGATK